MENHSKQLNIEQKWRSILLRDPSPDNFKKAYSQFFKNFNISKKNLLPQTFKKKLAVRALIKLIGKNKKILEIGCGDGGMALELAQLGQEDILATDVSPIAIKVANEARKKIKNVKVIFKVTDAITLAGVPRNYFNAVYSYDLLEHLHPATIKKHLDSVFESLSEGGRYYFWTPNRLVGNTSLGLHLKEYTIKELDEIIREGGLKLNLVEYRVGILAPCFFFHYPSWIKKLIISYEYFLLKTKLFKLLRYKIPRLIFTPYFIYELSKCKTD